MVGDFYLALLCSSLREKVLECLNTSGGDGMGAEKFRGSRFVLSGHVLPKMDGIFGIVACSGHENGADSVGLKLLRAGERASEDDISGASGVFGGLIWVISAKGCPCEGAQNGDSLGVLNTGLSVIGGDVGHFVGEGSGKLAFGGGNFEKAGVHADFSAREGKGIG